MLSVRGPSRKPVVDSILSKEFSVLALQVRGFDILVAVSAVVPKASASSRCDVHDSRTIRRDIGVIVEFSFLSLALGNSTEF